MPSLTEIKHKTSIKHREQECSVSAIIFFYVFYVIPNFLRSNCVWNGRDPLACPDFVLLAVK